MAQTNRPSSDEYEIDKDDDDDDDDVDQFDMRLFIYSIAALLIRILAYYVLSIGLTFYQRTFSRKYHIPLATVVFHNLSKFLLASLCRMARYIRKGEQRVSVPWKQTPKFALTGFSGGLDIAFAQWGLSLVTVSLFVMTKSTSILSVLAFALLFRLEKMFLRTSIVLFLHLLAHRNLFQSWSIVYIISMISLGLLLFTYKSTQFNLLGFLCILSSSIFSGFRWTTTQLVSRKTNFNIENPVDLIYYIAPWMIIASGTVAYVFERAGVSHVWNTYDRVTFISTALIGAGIAFALEFSEYSLIIHTSSLTFSVLGIVKETFTLLIGYTWDMDEISTINFIGLTICLCGVAGHILYRTSPLHDLHAGRKKDADETIMLSNTNPSMMDDISILDAAVIVPR